MQARFVVVGIGEALFDIFPTREVLGGAPLNVAIHAQQLLSRRQGRAVVVSRIGQDQLGQQIERELRERGIDTSVLQTDPDHDTGRVYVDINAAGEPTYEIVEDVAWDWLRFEADMEDLARRCSAVAFGTLAQRHSEARNAIYRFLDEARNAFKLYDANLRQSYYDYNAVIRSFERATAVKCNAEEFATIADLVGLRENDEDHAAWARRLRRRFDVKLVIITDGANGTTAHDDNGQHVGEPASYPPDDDADSVGAGDACSAGIIAGTALRWPLQRTLTLANRVGAYVVSQPGATPQLPEDILTMMEG